MENYKLSSLCTICGLSLSASGILHLIGGWDASIETLCIFMAIDYITGIMCALIQHKSLKTENGTFDSRISAKGLFKKAGIMLSILIAVRIDIMTGNTNYIRNSVILFFTANEGLSIIENLGLMGLPLPEIIKESFSCMQNTNKN